MHVAKIDSLINNFSFCIHNYKYYYYYTYYIYYLLNKDYLGVL